MPKKSSKWVNRSEMAAAAGVTVRTLFNWKEAGTVKAWRIVGKNRVQFDLIKVLSEIGGPVKKPKDKKLDPAPKPQAKAPVISEPETAKQRPPVIVTVQAPAPAPAPAIIEVINERRELSSGEVWLQEMEELRKERLEHEKTVRAKKYEKLTKEGKKWVRPSGFIDPFS